MLLSEKRNHNTLVIYVFYDEQGIVDEYVIYALIKIKEIADDIIVVANGSIKKEYQNVFKQIASDVVLRENIGYDGGAYKEVILSLLEKDLLKNYDKIVFANDTFYGPFYPLTGVFDFMADKECDFWGLSEYLEDKDLPDEKRFEDHVQGYFLVYKSEVVKSDCFAAFWEDFSLPRGYIEAIRGFEVGFCKYLENNGFKYTTYLREKGFDMNGYEGIVIYNEIPWKLINEYKFPILKYRAIEKRIYYDSSILNNIKAKLGFNVTMISDHQKRKDFQKYYCSFNEFNNKHKRIFIHGNGRYGKFVQAMYDYFAWQYDAVIVTERNHNEQNVIEFKDVIFSENDGIVIAVGLKLKDEITEMYKSIKMMDNLLCLTV